MWEWKNMWTEKICLSNLIICPNIHQFLGWNLKANHIENHHQTKKLHMTSGASYHHHQAASSIASGLLHLYTPAAPRAIYDWSNEKITIASKDIRDFRNSMHLSSKQKLLLVFMDKQNPAAVDMNLLSWNWPVEKKTGEAFCIHPE